MKRVKMVVAYDGTNYCGWQFQTNGITIEEVLNKTLSALLKAPVTVIGASRTDSGVHAQGNVAVFDMENRMPADKICFALNQRLPDDIRILESEEVPLDWHPRRRNCVKTYEYRILNRKIDMPTRRLYTHFCYCSLDVELMKKAAAYLVGEHDFKSFCTVRSQIEETVRTIYALNVEKEDDVITIRISGSGFLYNMVRIIAGTLIRVGMGAYSPEYVEEILDARDRCVAGPKASAKGLTLISLDYEKEVKPVIVGENKHWKYQLIQTEVLLKKKAYLIVERCTEEDYDRLVTRVVHQAMRNGAHFVYVSNRETDRMVPGKSYGYYVFDHVYDMVWMKKKLGPAKEMAEGFLFCPVEKTEITEYCHFYNEIFFDVPNSAVMTEAEVKAQLDCEKHHLFYLYRQGARVGFLTLIEAEDASMELDCIGISSEYEGQGIAGWAILNAEAYAAEKGKAEMKLLVSTGNARAYGLYCKLGYEETQKRFSWYRTSWERKSGEFCKNLQKNQEMLDFMGKRG